MQRPHIAFVINTLTPYRIQSHLRVKHEIPEFAIKTFVHWDVTRNHWVFKDPPDIGLVTFPDAAPESAVGTPDFYTADWNTGGRIIEHLERDRPAAVVCCGYAFPALLRIILWCRRRGVSCLLWGDSNIHADTATGVKRFIKQRFVRRIVATCDAILVCGQNGVRYFTRYGAQRDRLFYFPVEPDYALIERTDPALVREIGEKFNLRPGRRRLLVCSRLVPVKAVDQAIDAFVRIAPRRPELDLIILGHGPLRQRLEARIPSTAADRIRFVGFHDRQEVVNAFYKQCDVLLHPATWEPWGVVLLEAAAAGLAIITTGVVGAVPEVAKDGVNALIVRPNDRNALAKAIIEATDPARLDAMKAASPVVSRHFREECDPVRGLRDALRLIGLLDAPGSAR